MNTTNIKIYLPLASKTNFIKKFILKNKLLSSSQDNITFFFEDYYIEIFVLSNIMRINLQSIKSSIYNIDNHLNIYVYENEIY